MIALTLAVALAGGAVAAEPSYSWREALDAIRIVETGGEPDDGIGAIGDGGNALGPFQIWSIYHTDAAERDRTLDRYRSCLSSRAYSERVVRAYMKRYVSAAVHRLEAGIGSLKDVERVARTHNGGPRGASKEATVAYWRKVEKALARPRKRASIPLGDGGRRAICPHPGGAGSPVSAPLGPRRGIAPLSLGPGRS